jgi:hypothetical protein
MGIKAKIAQRKFQKLAKQHIHYPVLPDLITARKVGVLWQPAHKKAYQYMQEYFKRQQAIFRGFCVFEETANPLPDTNTITTHDLTWLGFPKPEKVEDFLNLEFDVLFNVALEQNFVLDYMTLFSKAKFKVGTSESESNFFDLNIKIGEKNDSIYLAKQQIFYLAQLNNTTSK